MSRLARCASTEDYRALARARLPRILFDYADGGAHDEATLTRNVAAFREALLTQRVMIDVGDVDARVSLFGQDLSMPLLCAPVGFAGMYARRGEVQAARAAAAAGIPFCLSTVGICGIEEVAAAAPPPWFQLYMTRDRGWMASLLDRASAAGCPVLVLTADLQTPGMRYRDIRSGMMRRLSPGEQIGRLVEGAAKPGRLWDVWLNGRPHRFGNLDGVLPAAASFADAWQWIGANFDPSVSWRDLDFIRAHWRGPILLKGVMAVEDVLAAVDNGVDGIVVSNHGGRQLDGAAASFEALAPIVEAVAGRLPVLVDGGIRSGLDVVKAMQRGASACLIGRAWLYALAAGGEAGVRQILERFRAEIRIAQTLTAQTRFG